MTSWYHSFCHCFAIHANVLGFLPDGLPDLPFVHFPFSKFFNHACIFLLLLLSCFCNFVASCVLFFFIFRLDKRNILDTSRYFVLDLCVSNNTNSIIEIILTHNKVCSFDISIDHNSDLCTLEEFCNGVHMVLYVVGKKECFCSFSHKLFVLFNFKISAHEFLFKFLHLIEVAENNSEFDYFFSFLVRFFFLFVIYERRWKFLSPI